MTLVPFLLAIRLPQWSLRNRIFPRVSCWEDEEEKSKALTDTEEGTCFTERGFTWLMERESQGNHGLKEQGLHLHQNFSVIHTFAFYSNLNLSESLDLFLGSSSMTTESISFFWTSLPCIYLISLLKTGDQGCLLGLPRTRLRPSHLHLW